MVNFERESNDVFAPHLLNIHRQFCRECFPQSEVGDQSFHLRAVSTSVAGSHAEGLQSATSPATGLPPTILLQNSKLEFLCFRVIQ